jgi:predicted MFS family arabinose efflux permease
VRPDAAVQDRGWTRYQVYALTVLSGAYMLNFADRHLLAVLIEPLKRDLGATDTQMGLLSGISFAIFYASFGIPIASWADRGNRRTILSIGIVLWSLMTVLTGASRNFLQVLAARTGVGVGETSAGAPVHSLLSDTFPPELRATALATYTAGAQLGAVLGLMAGGWLEENFGWRMAFVWMGLPGLLVALVVRTTIEEPPRGRFDGIRRRDPVSFHEASRFLLGQTSFVLMALGLSCAIFASYGASSWHPTLLRRVYAMSGTDVGIWLGFGAGGASMLGGIGAAMLTDRLARRDVRWYLWLPASSTALAVPLSFFIPFLEDVGLAVRMIPVWSFLVASVGGPIFAMVQSVARPEMRAVAAAVNMFVMTLFGMGLGPTFVGFTSETLRATHANDSLRFALALVTPLQILAALLFLAAARSLSRDLKHAAA